jgi:twitching motility protein PilT
LSDGSLTDLGFGADKRPVELETILRAAVEQGASDVHLKADKPPVMRYDGDLREMDGFGVFDSLMLEDVLNVIGALTPRRVAAFQDTGELDTAYQIPGLPRFRVNAFRQRGDISFAFRVIPREVPDFASLHLPRGVERLSEEHRGLVLVTGATGAGKTTTLAAVVGHINKTRRQHIVTIEDPIEILHNDAGCIINQREVGLDTESFNQALRRALRQDPDVILIGELRDSETAETALQAAESGHLVLSTMHTVDAAETISRLVEFFPAIKQPAVRSILAGVLRGVVSQRLLPRVGGGRRAAVEVMVANSRVQELIREDKAEFIPEAIKEGSFFDMQTMTDALIDLVVAGEVDEEVAAAAAPNRHDFTIALGRAQKEHAVEQEKAARVARGEDPDEPELPSVVLASDDLRLA